jgi:anti-anti-sigma regulatory factor
MTTAQMLLDSSRRQIVRLIALGLGALGLTFVAIVCAMLIFMPNSGLVIFLIALLLFLIGASITLTTLSRWPLLRAVLPLTVGLFVIIGIVGMLLPELAQPAAPFLAINVLIMAMSGNRLFTLIVAITSTLLAMTIVSSLPRPFPQPSIAAVIEPVTILAAGALVLVFWIVSSRFVAAQDTALALANQRADEAEIARAEAEAAHAEIERRSIEQEQLLDLVRTLELPIMSVGAGVLVAPLVGSLDARRVAAIQQHLFAQVQAQRAHTVVLDITGISAVDAAIAQALIETAQGARLLGAQTLLSGIRAEVAKTIAALGSDMAGIRSVANLGQALEASRHS